MISPSYWASEHSASETAFNLSIFTWLLVGLALCLSPGVRCSCFLGKKDGATVRRSIGTPALRNLSPFLMYAWSSYSSCALVRLCGGSWLMCRLDHATIKPGSGFPDHPHVCTYLLLPIQELSQPALPYYFPSKISYLLIIQQKIDV